MKAIVIGLGSMGKRRVRNLIANGVTDITGLDPREDRRKETEDKYSIKTIEAISEASDLEGYDVALISTPPDLHMYYAYMTYEFKIQISKNLYSIY